MQIFLAIISLFGLSFLLFISQLSSGTKFNKQRNVSSFYLMLLNIYYCEKLTFSKLIGKVNLKKCTSFEEQKGKRYIWKNFYFGIIIFSCLSSTRRCLRFLLNCFFLEIKSFYQGSLGNEVDFRDIMNVSPNSLAKN